jgi:HD-GYP domain-containing protein (c-di-GMP phosphodiesterase class II)
VAGHLAATGHGFRLGGDELAVILPTADPEPAAQHVCNAIAATEHELPIRSTVSLGYARFPVDGLDHERLVACADAALYHAKRLGKNRVCGYEVRAVESPALEDAPLRSRVRALWQLTEIVDAVDGDGSSDGHSRRVADLAVELAQVLRVPDDEVELIRLASRLHDLGKLTVPVEILGKSGALADLEWRAVREHPEIGRRILTSLGAGEIADWVLHQHEWWDGRGHPSGLAGEAIPRASRIIFVADAYDAMTNDRPFQAALGPDLALREVERCAGTQFDPSVVAALLEVRGGLLPVAAAG